MISFINSNNLMSDDGIIALGKNIAKNKLLIKIELFFE